MKAKGPRHDGSPFPRTDLRSRQRCRPHGVGRTKLYELIAAGEVETVKLGKSTRITTASLHDLIRRQREAG